MLQKIRSIALVVIGLTSIGLAIACYAYKFHGFDIGDMRQIADLLSFGIGSVLLVMGLVLLCKGLTSPTSVELFNEIKKSKKK